ncbi:MAG: hypothetical protein AAFO07_15655, partial [Bacteroidota bacterium]
MGCKRITLLATLFLFCINAPSYGQFTRQQLVTYAKTFEKMPENTFELQAYVPVDQRPATISAGSPASDLEWTVFDSDYLDGETDGYDTFYPVDPSDQFPGSNTVKLVEGTSLIHTSELYDGADGDRFVLGIDENPNPFFHRGQDSVDNDFYVIQHFDFRNGHIQLRGNASDYALLYADEIQDSVATTGWYLFYTADNSIDLIAFIYPCFQLFGNQQEAYLNAFCNSDSTLSLSDANQFRYAQPVATTPSIFNGIAQVGSTGKEVVSGITVDATGNMYLFGLTDSNLDGGPEFKNEYFVSKTSPDGQLLWVAELPVSEASLLFDATTDGEYLYAAGRTFGNLPGFQNQGRWDGVILKIDQETGEIVDTEQFGTSLIDGFGNITLDDDGHLYVSGAGADPATTGLGDPDFILAKYNKETLEQIWWAAEPVLPTSNRSTEAWGGITYIPGEEPGKGKIVVGGWFANNTAGIAGADGFLALFDDLDNSQPTKIKSTVIGSPGFEADWVWGNTVDRQGNIYAVGYTSGDLAGTNAGEGDAFIVKFDENLENPVFRQVGSNKAERFRKIAIDEKGAVYVSGFTYGDLVRDNQDRDYLSADIIVQKYDADLNLLAARQIGTPNEERGFLAMREGSLYLGGMTEGSMVAQNHGSFDGFLFALDPENLEFTQPNVQEPEEENELKAIATTFPEMPRGTAGLLPFVQGFPTFASGGPFNDLDFTILDTDYIDGENSGGDVFMPVDPADQFPGADKVKLIRCVLNTDLDQVYGSADADRIILGTHEINVPFFLSGPDSVDNDYAVILHLNFEAGYIQLKG